MEELHHAIRRLSRTPGFTAIAVLTIALGIGANVAAFNILNALVLSDLPVSHPEQLATVGLVMRNGTEAGLSFPAFKELRDHSSVFSSFIACACDMLLPVEIDGTLSRNNVSTVTGNFFSELGAKPAAGRLLVPSDVDLETFARSSLAVLGYRFWLQRFGGDASIIGRTLTVDGVSTTILGVTEPGFRGIDRTFEPEIYLPLTARDEAWTQASVLWLTVIGRRRPGTTLDDAAAAVRAQWPTLLTATMPASFASARRDNYLAIKPVIGDVTTRSDAIARRQYTRPLVVVLGLAVCALAIACVNLAGLMLTRTASRTHDIGIQVALGAQAARIARQIVVEGFLVSVAGAALGTAVAPIISTAVASLLLSGTVAANMDVRLHAPVLLASAAATCVVCVAFTAVPAWRASRRDAMSALPDGGSRTTTSGVFGQIVVVAQVALSIMLIVNTGLLIRTLTVLRSAPVGFDPTDVRASEVVIRPGAPPLQLQALRTIQENVAGIPGVRSASVSRALPLAGGGLADLVAAAVTPGDEVRSETDYAAPAYFRTVGVPLLQGRDFTWGDTSEHRVAIISQSLARRLYGERSAVGESLNLGFLPQHQNLQIVGVVTDARLHDVKNPNTYAVYIPASQEPELFADGGVLLTKGRAISATELRQAIGGFRLDVLLGPDALTEFEERSLGRERLVAEIAAFFGGLTLLLAAVGVYGLMSSSVVSRTREIGIRLALGATRTRVLASVVGKGTVTALLGVVVGIGPAILAVRFIQSLVLGITPHDPVTMVVAPVVLVMTAVAACMGPAVRASRVDVMRAIRME